jgi:NTE family protein
MRRKLRDLLRRRGGPVAFVLSGGGNLGAIQVGMLRALVDHDIRPDMVLGCSVGALNGAAYAQEPTLPGVARIEELWRGIDGRDLMPSGWFPHAVAIARKGESIHGNEGLTKVVEAFLTTRTFEELEIPFQCVATDVLAVREAWFDSGPLIPPILASSALPSIYPAVEIDGVRYLDGAIVNDVPVARAVELGARTLYVLHCGSFDRPRPEPKRPLDVAVQAYWIARHHRFKRDLASLPSGIDAVVLPTGQPPNLRFNDFTRSPELIGAAYSASAAFLDGRVDDSEVDGDDDAHGRVLTDAADAAAADLRAGIASPATTPGGPPPDPGGGTADDEA